MAASANPTGNHQEGSSNQNVTPSPPPTANGVAVNSNNSGGNTSTAAAAAVSADTQSALRHNPGISLDWTPEEQTMLEDLLFKYTSDSTIVRYAKIAMQLKDKTVREVALRCRWMTSSCVKGCICADFIGGRTQNLKKENGKRRKEDHSARKNKDRREKGTDTSAKSTPHLTTRPNGPSYALPMIPMDNDDGILYEAIGGVTGELFEQNAQMFNQISANFAAFQMISFWNKDDEPCKDHGSSSLPLSISLYLVESRTEMILLNDLPEVMKQMPPLPVKVNEELANNILGHASHQMKS
ncbi:hypothetical protein Goshw_029268 [Gossypium schwendimanii]|uniref:Myb-like domain-containing protein n=1 Tax=Gossypium schwendimanii TaxID=34291 RepID=A0A7J9L6N2_GOSSC|nr:hypothetical protein [Gossypium schwendimanii]